MQNRSNAKYYYRILCALILMGVALYMFAFIWIPFVTENNQTSHLTGYGNVGMSLMIYVILYIFIGFNLHAFRIGVERKANVIASQVLTLLLVDVSEILISMAITGQFRFFQAFIWRYAFLFLVQSLVLALLTIPMISLYRIIFPPLQVMEIYGDRRNDLYRKVDSLKYKYHIEEQHHFSQPDLEFRILEYDAVLINDVPSHEKNRILKICFDHDKRVYFVPKISDIIVKTSEELNLLDTPLFLCRNRGISTFELAFKRAFDIIASVLALVVLSPVMLGTAIAIKLEDGGPVFFRQERCTIGGKRFMILKFRSMIVDAEKDGRPHPAGEKDERITKVGHFIRATRIDELPQFINILKSDMSIVGPRPERVEHVEKYTKEIPEFTFRSKVKGGLTGYAQVYGKYNTTALDKLKLDLMYILNYSILLDLQIIFETIKVLFQKESTEGFSEERAAEIHDTVGGIKKDE